MNRLSATFLALVLAGCTASTLAPATPPAAAPVLGLQLGVPAQEPLPAPASTGGIRFSVRWPGYQTQQMTYSTVALDLAVLDAANAPVATASVARPATDAQMLGIPAGTYTLSVQARASDSTVTATASTPIRVVPNLLAAVPVRLVPLHPPTVTGLSRSVVPAGGSFWIFGTFLQPPAGGTYSVIVDGQPVPGSTLQGGASAIGVTSAPPWLTPTSRVTLSVDGLWADGSQPLALRVIDHVGITPAIATMVAGGSQTFQWHAYLDAAGTQEVTDDLRFNALLTDLQPALNPVTGLAPFVLNGRTVSTSATGSFMLQVTEEGQTATMGITVVAPAPNPSATPFDPLTNPGGGGPGGSGGSGGIP